MDFISSKTLLVVILLLAAAIQAQMEIEEIEKSDAPVFQIDAGSIRPADQYDLRAVREAITLEDPTTVKDLTPTAAVQKGIIGMIYVSIKSKTDLIILPIYDSLASARTSVSSHFIKLCRLSPAQSSILQQECVLQPVILEPAVGASSQPPASWSRRSYEWIKQLVFGNNPQWSIPVLLHIFSSKLIETTMVEPIAKAWTENQPIEQKMEVAEGLNNAVKVSTFVTAKLIKRASFKRTVSQREE